MKILHTSDWHLGQKFISKEREEEHQLALDWLVEFIEKQRIELLLVCGDVFDIGSPPNYARALYYRFLKKLWFTGCRHVVIIGGNHDSPPMLNAPKELLQLLDVHVVGNATENIKDEILELKDTQGKLECVVAAVPFLRDQDLRRTTAGESGVERIERIKEGILQHYRQVGEAVEKFRETELPILATGHLYATGAKASDKQENIYLGNLENISAGQFPEVFDYVALGHIHRAQAVGGKRHIRYSGSLIPLSFSETKDDKVVTVLEFEGKALKDIEEVPVPVFRRLKTLEGDLEKVKKGLEKLNDKYKDHLTTWVEVVVDAGTIVPNLNGILQDFVADMNLNLLKIKTKESYFSLDEQVQVSNLEDLDHVEVFRKKCESAGKAPEELEELVQMFRELETWMLEREGER
jgi:exonuclease SbcD